MPRCTRPMTTTAPPAPPTIRWFFVCASTTRPAPPILAAWRSWAWTPTWTARSTCSSPSTDATTVRPYACSTPAPAPTCRPIPPRRLRFPRAGCPTMACMASRHRPMPSSRYRRHRTRTGGRLHLPCQAARIPTSPARGAMMPSSAGACPSSISPRSLPNPPQRTAVAPDRAGPPASLATARTRSFSTSALPRPRPVRSTGT